MPPNLLRSGFFALVSAIYQNQASKAELYSPRYALASQLVMDLEIAPLYGGIAAMDAADEVDVQRHWLAFLAKMDAQAENAKRDMPK